MALLPRGRHFRILACLFLSCARWFCRPAPVQVLSQIRRPLTPARCKEYLRRFGSCSSAYLHLQEGLRHFETDLGVVSYFSKKTYSRLNLIVAPPLCAPENLESLLTEFLDNVPGRHIFCGVRASAAELLRSRGYQATVFGTDFNIPIQEFRVSGRGMKHLKRIKNLGSHGLQVVERSWSEVDRAAVRAISADWLRARNGSQKELRALTRPVEFADEWEVRKFYVYDENGTMLGFAFFDPIFRENVVVGYTANILRTRPDARPHGILDYAVYCALEKFRQEGLEILSLGISPLHGVRRMPGDNRALTWLLNKTYVYGDSVYPFKGLASHKLRWRAEEELVYACTADVNPLRAVLFTLQATNAI